MNRIKHLKSPNIKNFNFKELKACTKLGRVWTRSLRVFERHHRRTNLSVYKEIKLWNSCES